MRRFIPFFLISLAAHVLVLFVFGGLLGRSSTVEPARIPYLKVTLSGPLSGNGYPSDDTIEKGMGSTQTTRGSAHHPAADSVKAREVTTQSTPSPSLPRPVAARQRAAIPSPRKDEPMEDVPHTALPEPQARDSGPSAALSAEDHPRASGSLSSHNTRGEEAGIGTYGGTEGMGDEGGIDPSRLEFFKDKIWERISHCQNYPLWAKKNNIEGTVVMRLTLNRSGQIQGLDLEKTSGHSVLDEAAKEAVLRGAPYPPFPAWLPHTRLALKVPIRFTLGSLP